MERGINISINNVCNNNCSYCFQSTYNNTEEKKFISLEHYSKILNFLENSQIKHINILGGEPSLHPEALKIVKLTLEKNFSVLFITNLLLNDDNFWISLANLDINFLVNATQTDFNKKLFEHNFDLLLKNKNKNRPDSCYSISFCLTENNEENDEVLRYIQLLSEKFKDYNLNFRVSPAAPGGEFKKYNILNFSNFYKKLDDLLSLYNNTFNFDCCLDACQIDYDLISQLKNNIIHNPNEIIDGFSQRCNGALDILLDDKLYFCNSLRDIGVELFKYNNFDDAYMALSLEISKIVNDQRYKYCDQKCEKKDYCMGHCPAKIYNLKKWEDNA